MLGLNLRRSDRSRARRAARTYAAVLTRVGAAPSLIAQNCESFGQGKRMPSIPAALTSCPKICVADGVSACTGTAEGGGEKTLPSRFDEINWRRRHAPESARRGGTAVLATGSVRGALREPVAYTPRRSGSMPTASGAWLRCTRLRA